MIVVSPLQVGRVEPVISFITGQFGGPNLKKIQQCPDKNEMVFIESAGEYFVQFFRLFRISKLINIMGISFTCFSI